jgi:hypothetical protein
MISDVRHAPRPHGTNLRPKQSQFGESVRQVSHTASQQPCFRLQSAFCVKGPIETHHWNPCSSTAHGGVSLAAPRRGAHCVPTCSPAPAWWPRVKSIRSGTPPSDAGLGVSVASREALNGTSAAKWLLSTWGSFNRVLLKSKRDLNTSLKFNRGLKRLLKTHRRGPTRTSTLYTWGVESLSAPSPFTCNGAARRHHTPFGTTAQGC